MVRRNDYRYRQHRGSNLGPLDEMNVPFRDRAADKMKRAMATWSALFGMLFFILGWILLRNVFQVPVDNPQLTILNLILSSLAGLQCFILLIAAKRGEAQ